jgi:hypothetical protein
MANDSLNTAHKWMVQERLECPPDDSFAANTLVLLGKPPTGSQAASACNYNCQHCHDFDISQALQVENAAVAQKALTRKSRRVFCIKLKRILHLHKK